MSEQFKMPMQESIQPENSDEIFARELVEAIEKMKSQLNETGKSIREIIPENRNFNIEFNEAEKGVEIKLRHKENGKEKKLNMFLPPGHFFEKDESFIYRSRQKKIGYPENEVKFRGFLLSLFHEIGHYHEKIEHSISTWESLKALWFGVAKLIKSISIKKDIQDKEVVKKTTYRFTSLTADEVLPGWYIDKRSEDESKSERNAWAFALRSLRKLNQEGYNVFAGFENVSQIQSYVAYCLYTYDVDLFLKKLYSGNLTGDDLMKLDAQSTFWKQSKKYNKVVVPDENTE